MAQYQGVKVINGALDEVGNAIVLRGVIDTSTLPNLKVDSYQREERSTSDLSKMVTALKEGKQLPDIEIGVRGGNWTERGGVFYITDECYIVDGLQRVTASKRRLAEDSNAIVRLGAMFHFNTNIKWEKDRFKVLNGGEGGRVPVSPNVLLRNSADESTSVSALLAMTQNDKEFVLKGKVSWNQRRARGELMNALTVLKIIGALHSHFGPGRSPRYYHLMKSTDKTMVTVGPNTWRANVRAFFEFLDQAFGVKTIKYADLSAHIRFGFLRTLAQVFADHKSFWIDTKLTIDPRDFQKMRAFPINDPGVVALIGGSSSVNPILYQKIVAHLNSGRRTTRMVKWNGQAADGIVSMDIDQGGGDDDSDTGPDSTMGEVEFATQ
jgi:hypothetical protein